MASQCCLYYQFICCLYNHYIPSCRPYSPSLPFQPVHQWTSRLQVVIIPPVERNVIVGNSVVFVCQVNGKVITADNSYRWKWSKDNGEDLPTDVRIFFGYLTIYNVQPYHTGRYLCEVERMGLKGLAETKLTVQTASTSLAVSGLQMIPSRQTVTRGKTGRFECRLTSETDKETNLTWSFGSQKQLREGIQTSNGVLTIDNVESRDEGDYFCTAQLTNGQAFAKGHLTVVNATAEESNRAVIDMWLNDQLLFKPKTVPRGGQVKLKCRNAQGAPGIFTLDTGPSRGDVFDQIHKPILSADQSEVTINHFNTASQGSYICRIFDGEENILQLICEGNC